MDVVDVDFKKCRASLETRFAERDEQLETRRQAALEAVRIALRCAGPRIPTIRRLFLFGSVLTPGAFRGVSDIDIGIEGELTAEDFFRLWREIEEAAPGWQIDLVELDRARLHFVDRVREEGELVYAA